MPRANGEGSVYRTKAGRWRGSVSLPDGSRKYVSGRTRKEANDKVARTLADLSKGGLVASNQETLESFLGGWLARTRESLRPSTASDYEGIVDNHLLPILGKVKITALTPDHIAHLHRELAAKGLSAARIVKIHRVLSKALKDAQAQELTARNVTQLVKPPRVPGNEMEYLTQEEVRRLVAFLREDPWAARWHLALIGMRQGEVLGLRWSDIDLETGHLTITKALQRLKGKGLVLVEPKSCSSKRPLRLPAEVLQSLRTRRSVQNQDRLRTGDRWTNPDDLVFTDLLGHGIDAGVDNRAWKDLLTKAELRPIRLHDARHTAATMLLTTGTPVRAAMEWLGHSQVSQTMRYTHVVPQVAEETSQRLGSAMFGE